MSSQYRPYLELKRLNCISSMIGILIVSFKPQRCIREHFPSNCPKILHWCPNCPFAHCGLRKQFQFISLHEIYIKDMPGPIANNICSNIFVLDALQNLAFICCWNSYFKRYFAFPMGVQPWLHYLRFNALPLKYASKQIKASLFNGPHCL